MARTPRNGRDSGRRARRPAVRHGGGPSGIDSGGRSARSRYLLLSAVFVIALIASTVIQFRGALPPVSAWAGLLLGHPVGRDGAATAARAYDASAGPQGRLTPYNGSVTIPAADEEVTVRRIESARRDQEESGLATAAQVEMDDAMRSDAVYRLRFTVSPQAVPALGQVLASDTSPRVRYEALESLRVLFANDMDPDGTIRQIIQAAENDRDPQVAAHAREIGRELHELLNPVDSG